MLITSWLNSFLLFNEESLDVVIRKLERHYNISIILDDPRVKTIKVSGKLDLKEDVKDVLDNISIIAPIKCIINKDNIVITFNK